MSITAARARDYLIRFLLRNLTEAGPNFCTKDDEVRHIILFHLALVPGSDDATQHVV